MSNVIQVNFRKKPEPIHNPKVIKREAFQCLDAELSDRLEKIKLQIARLNILLDANEKGVYK